jgi:hypothetical protein
VRMRKAKACVLVVVIIVGVMAVAFSVNAYVAERAERGQAYCVLLPLYWRAVHVDLTNSTMLSLEVNASYEWHPRGVVGTIYWYSVFAEAAKGHTVYYGTITPNYVTSKPVLYIVRYVNEAGSSVMAPYVDQYQCQ